MGSQWHQLDHMQIICTLLQTDNYASTSSLNFITGWMLLVTYTNSVKALKEQTQFNYKHSPSQIYTVNHKNVTVYF